MTHAEEIRELLCGVVLRHVYRIGSGLCVEEQIVEDLRAVELPERTALIDPLNEALETVAACAKDYRETAPQACPHCDPPAFLAQYALDVSLSTLWSARKANYPGFPESSK